MKTKLPQKWIDILDILDIAFQPILNINTAATHAVEALLRNTQEAGFHSIFALFDDAYKDGCLYTFDIYLREKTIQKFIHIKHCNSLKLFYNLDNRILDMDNFSRGNTSDILQKYGIKKDTFCFEISERHETSHDIDEILRHYKEEDFCIAIDDFGVGYAGFKLLYDITPDVIKIDRFFIHKIQKNMKKKLMVRNITHLATILGIKVVAEGIETQEELLTCKEIGCHLAQGYFIQKPTLETSQIRKEYQEITQIINSSNRESKTYQQIRKHLDFSPSLPIKSKVNKVINYFKENPQSSILSIVNHVGEPLGIIKETQIKDYLYSPFGLSLLSNETSTKSKIKSIIEHCASADLYSDISTIIELFSNHPESVGIIITKDGRYYGFLSARAIITIMNEQNLIFAREQNPLTKLPGNTMIERYLKNCSVSEDFYILCYFDLDNFKAFNDVYGFRNGDRVILLFSETMVKILETPFFNAHIGGDDFFTAIKLEKDPQKYLQKIELVIEKFTTDVRDFYSQEDKKNNCITAKDRDNQLKEFPLLTVSASALIISSKTKNRTLKNINKVLSLQKKVAKEQDSHLAISSLL
ncbi:MAG: GGDEF domain-containing protein [Helicobacteraceae bacterium]|nr:GGDEF domain-containing protein [Helicobacteraceae bacterium]